MPQVSACHIGLIVFHCIATIMIIAAAPTTWVKFTVTNPSNGVGAEEDFKLFQLCITNPVISQCKSWSDLMSDSSAPYCQSSSSSGTGASTGSATQGDALTLIRLSEAFAIIAIGAGGLHFLIALLYSLSVLKSQVWVVVSLFLTPAAAAVSFGTWVAMESLCSKSLCQTLVNTASASNLSSECGPSVGLFLMIAGGALAFICGVPFFCVKRPMQRSELDAAYTAMNTTPMAVHPGYVVQQQQAFYAPQQQQPGYAPQPGYPAQQNAYAPPTQ